MPNLFRATMGGGGSDIEPYIVIVTLNEDFAGQTVTLEQSGQDTLTKVCPASAPFEVTFKPMHDGVWIAKSTTIDGKESVASTEPLLEWGTYTVELKSSFNFEEWLTQGRVTETFDSLDDVLADEKTIRQLMTVHDSVDFLANNITDEDATKIFSNDLCAKWINLRDYALDTLYANSICKTAMDNADKYFYGEWALINDTWQPKGNIPIMTANNAPYGEVSASGTQTSSIYPYFALNDDFSNEWSGRMGNTTETLSYKFVNPICAKQVGIIQATKTNWIPVDASVVVEACNDGITYQPIGTIQLSTADARNLKTYPLDNPNYYMYYRLRFESGNAHWTGETKMYCVVTKLQFYGRELSVSVPKMTSNTEPYGEIIYGNFLNDTYKPLNAFDSDSSNNWRTGSSSFDDNAWLGYRFNKPTLIKWFYCTIWASNSAGYNCTFVIQALVDGTWVTVSDETTYTSSVNWQFPLDLDSAELATDYRIKFLSGTHSASDYLIATINFYGLDYSERDFDTEKPSKYIYDHGLEFEELEANANAKYSSATIIIPPIKEPNQLHFLSSNIANSNIMAFINTKSRINLIPYKALITRFGSKGLIRGVSFGGVRLQDTFDLNNNIAFADVSPIVSVLPLGGSTDSSYYIALESGWLERAMSICELYLEPKEI